MNVSNEFAVVDTYSITPIVNWEETPSERKFPPEDTIFKYVVYDGNFDPKTRIFSKFIEQVALYFKESCPLTLPVNIEQMLESLQANSSLREQRDQYDELLKEIEYAPIDDVSATWASELARALYTQGGTAFEGQTTFLNQIVDPLTDECDSLSKQLLEANKKIRQSIAQRKVHGFEGHCRSSLLVREDLMRHHFLPATVFNIGTCAYLAFPRPYERDLDNGHVGSISNIFMHHLTALKARGEKQLYINLLERRLGSNEGDGCLTLEELARNYNGTLFVISLDVKSAFYQQSNEESQNFKDFKIQFSQHLESDAYYFADLITKEQLTETIDQVHKKFFPNRENLTQMERKAFIDLYNIVIGDEITKIIDPNFVNATCAYTKDRGPIYYATKFFLTHQVNGQLSKEDAHQFLTMVLAPAPCSHMVATSDIGLRRLSGVIDVMLQNQ